jgi:hypothetical protein
VPALLPCPEDAGQSNSTNAVQQDAAGFVDFFFIRRGSLKQESGAKWIDDFIDRYLAFGKMDQRLGGLAAAAW